MTRTPPPTPASERGDIVTEQVVRESPERLVMIRRRTTKDDGRYLLYYDFRREPPPAP